MLKRLLLALLVVHCLASCAPRLTADQRLNASQATLEWLGKRYGLISDPSSQHLVSRVVQRLGSSAVFYAQSNRKSLSYPTAWRVAVLNSDDANAFSIGSGTIVVTKGLLKQLDSEAAFAAVLSHEMSHQLLGHTDDALNQARAGRSPNFQFELAQEILADSLSLHILKMARYDLRYATDALALAYRPGERIVVSQDNWLGQRAAALRQEIDRLESGTPTTANSREYVKVRLSFGALT